MKIVYFRPKIGCLILSLKYKQIIIFIEYNHVQSNEQVSKINKTIY